MNKLFKLLSLSLICIWLASGCAPRHKNIYYWGQYEHLLHDMYINPGKAAPDVQIDKLNTDIQQAADNGKPVPPGIYAHLGFVYATQGDGVRAKAAFNQEKEMYPESSQFIDGLMKRAFKKG